MDLFASDLHLSSATPALNAAFVALLEGRARTARRVFLLGDLFEVWAGDEDADDDEGDAEEAEEAEQAEEEPAGAAPHARGQQRS